jgi:hypothetical protein
MKEVGGEKQVSVRCQGLPPILCSVASHKTIAARAKKFAWINLPYSGFIIKDNVNRMDSIKRM